MDADTRKQIDEDYARAGSPVRMSKDKDIEPMKPVPLGVLLAWIVIHLGPWIAVVIIVIQLYAALR